MPRWRRWRADRLDPRGELGLLPAERLAQHHLHVASTPRRPRDEPRLRTPRPGPPRLARLGSMRRREGHSSHCNCCSAAPCPSERRLLLPFAALPMSGQLSKPASARLVLALGGRAGRAAQLIGGKKRLLDYPGDLTRRKDAIQRDARKIRARSSDGERGPTAVDQTKKRCLRKRGKRSGDARERLEHPDHQNGRGVDGQHC